MERTSSRGVLVLDLHGKTQYQARIMIDSALRHADRSLYRLHLVHGYHAGTALQEMIRREYAAHPRLQAIEAKGPGATELVLRAWV